jgi:dTMP kinase
VAARKSRGKFITFEGGEGTGKSTHAHELRERLEKAGHKVIETREPGGTPGAEIIRHLIKSGAVEPLGAFAEAVMIAAARDDHVTQLIKPTLDKGTWVVCDRFSDSTKAYQGAGGGVEDELLGALEQLTVGETLPDLTVILDAPAEIALARARGRGDEVQAAEQAAKEGEEQEHAKGKANGKDQAEEKAEGEGQTEKESEGEGPPEEANDGKEQAEPEAEGEGANTGNGADRFEKESLAFHERLRQAFLKIAEEHPERCVVIDATADKDTVAEKVWASVAERLKP